MILVFGGTTEGRKAVETLEEAGALYYYSTRNDGQQIELVNGVHLTGDMDVPKMIECCREHDIRLIIDAAHPFAEELHRNLLFVAKHICAPIIRYDRIYPKHDSDLIWCKDFNEAVNLLEANHIERLLALTGVSTIGQLQQYWKKRGTDNRNPEMRHECWFRILNRRASKFIAMANRFPEERLVYYETDETSSLIDQLHPDAIITKESGLSGGFTEKVEAARNAGLKIFVVERPQYPPHTPNPQNVQIKYINGPYGLRRAVERLLPEFYPLHSGLTTGTCATAAAIAATIRLTKGEMPEEVPVLLPDGETIMVAVGYGEDYAYCIKEAGDDPDVTNGIEVRASVSTENIFSTESGNIGIFGTCADKNLKFLNSVDNKMSLEIEGGEGVGRFTLPGFDYPPGEAAINKAPREMIRKNVLAAVNHGDRPHDSLRVTISVPNGEEIAKRTFNPRLGIEGGISIIGVSGIVKPFSEEAFIDSIRKCMEVAKASGSERVVINSGGKSERFVKALYPELPRQAFVEYGNYIGETLKIANELNIPKVTLGVMLGKAVKLAAGHLDTHSRKTTMDKDFIQQMLQESGITIDISDITLARELWERIPSNSHQQQTRFAQTVIRHCAEHCNPLLPNGELTILLIDDNGKIFSTTN
jgi:cobalt-precorrin-5B (C1)-methyltransferase